MSITLRTRVYIDGYNFYYGCLKRTSFKWLDPVALFERQILPSVLFEPEGRAVFALEPLAVKFFTAPILRNFASTQDSVSSQERYHAALTSHQAGRIVIVKGYYDAKEARARRAGRGISPTNSEFVEIWKLEEKQSDVSLALHAYSDAIRGEIDLAVIVTNDTDRVPALAMIRRDTSVAIGLVVPTRSNERAANADLTRLADWTRTHITADELAASQLPRVVPGGRTASHKPVSWYSHPELVGQAIDEAVRVRGGRGPAMKWLGQPCGRLGGRVPFDMLETETEASELAEYMAKWAADHE